MADRGLSANAITLLGASTVTFYHLLRVDFSTKLYYTDAPHDISYDDGDGAQTYVSSANCPEFPDIKESLGIKPSSLSFKFTGTAANHALTLTENYKNAPVYIYRSIGIDASEVIKLFEGYLDSYKTDEDAQAGTSEVTWRCVSHWANWEAQSGRWINSTSQARIGYSSDGFFDFAGVTDIVLDYWGGFRKGGSLSIEDIVRFQASLNIYSNDRFGYVANGLDNGVVNTLWASYYPNLAALADLNLNADNVFNWEKRTATTTKLPVAYGECHTRGDVVFRAVSGTNLKYLWEVIALSEGECESLRDNKIEVLVDNELVVYTDGIFDGKIKYSFYNGSDSQTESSSETEGNSSVCDATALRAASSLWDSSNRDGAGICYVIVRYEYDKEIFDTKPELIFLLNGMKVLDPNNLGNPIAFSKSSPWIQYDYLSNTRYGKGLMLAKGTASGATTDATGYSVGDKEITLASAGTGTIVIGDTIQFTGDSSRYVVAVGDTDVSNGGTITIKGGLINTIASSATAITVITRIVTLQDFDAGATYAATTNYDFGTSTLIPLFEFNGLIDTNNSIKKNAEIINFSMRGKIAWVGGNYKLVIWRDDAVASVYSFDETNVMGSFSVSETGIKSLLNLVEYEFIDPALGYVAETVFEDSATYLSEDSGRELKTKVTNKFENNRYRAMNHAQTILDKSRSNIIGSLNAQNADALQIELGDIIDITRATQGWTSKKFRVGSMTLKTNGDVIINGFEEYNDSDFDWYINTEVTLPTITTLIDPFDVSAIAPTSVTLGTATQRTGTDGSTVDRGKVTWTAPAGSVYLSHYEIQVQETNDGSTEWTDLGVVQAGTDLFITFPAIVGATFDAQVRAVNTLGKPSAWVGSSDHEVTGTAVQGGDVQLDGTNSYDNSSYYFHEYFDSLTRFIFTPSANFTIDELGVDIRKSGSGTVFTRDADINDVVLSWAKDRKFRAVIKCTDFGESSGFSTAITIGCAETGLSFKLDWNDTNTNIEITGTSENATSSEDTSVIATIDNGDTVLLECVLVTGVSAKFTVDGSASQTNTTYVPESGYTTNEDRILHFTIANKGTTSHILFQEYQFTQSP